MNDFDNFWDDISGSLNHDSITNTDIFPIQFILIMKCGVSNSDAANLNGVHDGDRSEGAGAAHLDCNFFYNCFSLLRFVFCGDGPSRTSCDKSQILLKG